MTEGLLTRIGQWIDRKWESSATQRELQDQETKCSQRHIGALSCITELKADLNVKLGELGSEALIKDMADLKTRLEKIELYSGMTRKVDPTKPPVVKSAFQM